MRDKEVPMSKRPVWVDGKRYESMADAAAAIGSDRTSVCRAAKYGHLLKGRRIRYVREAGVKRYDFPREFRCRTCGAFVHVNDPVDKRTVFCSPLCSRRYWRHPERYEREAARK